MINENDPRLLAYVLGELSDSEEAEIRWEIIARPELRQAVEDYRQLADVLTGIYAAEPLPEQSLGLGGSVTAKSPSKSSLFRTDRRTESAEWRWTRFALQATLVLFFCGGLYAVLNPVRTDTGDSQAAPALVSFVSSEDIAQLDDIAKLAPTISFSSHPGSPLLADSGTGSESESDSEPQLPRLPRPEQTEKLSDFGFSAEELAKNNPPLFPTISDSSFSSDFAFVPAAKPERYSIPGLDRSLAYEFRDARAGHKSAVRSTIAISRSNIFGLNHMTGIASRSPKTQKAQKAAKTQELQKTPALEVWQEAPFESPLEKPIAVLEPEATAESYFLVRSFLLDIDLLPPDSVIDVSQIVNYLENRRLAEQPKEESESSESSDVRVSVELGTHPWLPGLWLARIVFEQNTGLDPCQRFQIKFNPAQVGAYRRIGSGTLTSNDGSSVYETAPSVQADSRPAVGLQNPSRCLVALYELVPHAALDNPAGVPAPSGYAQTARPAQENPLSANQAYSGPALVCSQQRPAFSNVLANFGSDAGATPIQLFQIEIGSPTRLSDNAANTLPFNAVQKIRCYLPKAERLEETARQPEFRFSAAVALWAQLLAGSPYSGAATIDSVEALLDGLDGASSSQEEFLEMVRKTRKLFQNEAP